MNKTVVLQELGVVVLVKNYDPALLNPSLLKYADIIRPEWKLARPPLYTNSVAQMTFENGISIVAEPARIMFLEEIERKADASVLVPGIAHKYVSTLSNMEYQGMGFNCRGYFSFDNQQDAAHKYITETLLSPGSWHSVGTTAPRIAVNFAYTLERCLFNLTVSEAALRFPDERITPILLFSGTFNYNIASNTVSERIENLHQAIQSWQADLETFKDIVNSKFLAKVAENKAAISDSSTSQSRFFLN